MKAGGRRRPGAGSPGERITSHAPTIQVVYRLAMEPAKETEQPPGTPSTRQIRALCAAIHPLHGVTRGSRLDVRGSKQ